MQGWMRCWHLAAARLRQLTSECRVLSWPLSCALRRQAQAAVSPKNC